MRNPERALENDAKIGSIAASKCFQAASSKKPVLIKVHNTRKVLYLERVA